MVCVRDLRGCDCCDRRPPGGHPCPLHRLCPSIPAQARQGGGVDAAAASQGESIQRFVSVILMRSTRGSQFPNSFLLADAFHPIFNTNQSNAGLVTVPAPKRQKTQKPSKPVDNPAKS